MLFPIHNDREDEVGMSLVDDKGKWVMTKYFPRGTSLREMGKFLANEYRKSKGLPPNY